MQNQISKEKQELRKKIKLIRKDYFSKNPDYRKKESERIFEKIINSKDFTKSQLVLAFMPLADEVEISPVLQICVNQNKMIAVPKVIPETNLMDFYFIDEKSSKNQLKTGSFGISEPDETFEKFEIPLFYEKMKNKSPLNILILVPGLGFTKDGKRLGRGKGFYDRYLSFLVKECKKYQIELKKTGICFPFQILDEIPVDKNDFWVDEVIF